MKLSPKITNILKFLALGFLLLTGCDAQKNEEGSKENSDSENKISENQDSKNERDNKDSQNDPGTLSVCTDSDSSGCGGALSSNLSAANRNIVTVKENISPNSVGTLNVGAQQLLLQGENSQENVKFAITSAMEGSTRALNWISEFLNRTQPELIEIDKKQGSINIG